MEVAIPLMKESWVKNERKIDIPWLYLVGM